MAGFEAEFHWVLQELVAKVTVIVAKVTV